MWASVLCEEGEIWFFFFGLKSAIYYYYFSVWFVCHRKYQVVEIKTTATLSSDKKASPLKTFLWRKTKIVRSIFSITYHGYKTHKHRWVCCTCFFRFWRWRMIYHFGSNEEVLLIIFLLLCVRLMYCCFKCFFLLGYIFPAALIPKKQIFFAKKKK